MALKLTCPACTTTFGLTDDQRGKKAFCPKCGQALVITGAGTAKRDERGSAVQALSRSAASRRTLLLPGAVALLLLGGGIIVALILSRGGGDGLQQVAKQDSDQSGAAQKLYKLPPEPEKKTPAPQAHKDVPSTPPTKEPRKEKEPPAKELMKNEEAKKKGPVVIPPVKVEEPKSAPLPVMKLLTVLKVKGGGAVAFSPDDKKLAVGSYTLPTTSDTRLNWGTMQETKVLDIATERATATLAGNGGLAALAFTVDGKTVIAGSAWWAGMPLGFIGNVHRWNPASGQTTAILNSIPMGGGFALSPDATIIAGYSAPGRDFNTLVPRYETDADGTIKLWDATTGKLKASLTGSGGHTKVAFAPDGKTLASALGNPDASGKHKIKIWNVATAQSSLTIVLPGYSYSGPLFVNPTTVANLYQLKADTFAVGRWDVVTGAKLPDILPGDLNCAFAFSPDGKIMATATSSKGFHLWNVVSGKRVATVSNDDLGVARLAFSHDGTLLAAGSFDSVKVWRLSSVPEQDKK